MNDDSKSSAPARKKRAPPVPVTVTAVQQVTPKLVRITFTGAGLGVFAFAKPAAHMKLFFPDGPWPPPGGVEGAPRPPSRTYTPRRFDANSATLEVEFVLHGSGLASDWAARAEVGASMLVAGPGGGYPVDEAMTKLVIIADDTALPAAGMIVESIPADCPVIAICEVSSTSEQRPLSPVRDCDVTWLHLKDGETPGAGLFEAIEARLPELEGAHWWIACEAAAMRRLRDRLIADLKIDKKLLHTRGYWKYGASNHPDHDYGDD